MKIDDEVKFDLLERIQAKLECEPELNLDNVKVSVFNGIATVTGTVPNYPDKTIILKVIRTEPGIIAWKDEINVEIPASHRRTDEQLVAAADQAIDVITTVPSQSIRVTVRDGWLTLAGEVGHQSQRDAVEHAVCYLTGLRGVTNLILIAANGFVPEGQSCCVLPEPNAHLRLVNCREPHALGVETARK